MHMTFNHQNVGSIPTNPILYKYAGMGRRGGFRSHWIYIRIGSTPIIYIVSRRLIGKS